MRAMILLILLIACTPKPTDTGAAGPDSGETGGTGSTGETAESADSEESDEPVDSVEQYCDEAPTVTYESWGRGFLTESCNGCHASSAPDRHGAPEDVHFDTVDEVWTWSNVILSVATGDAPTMPPRGGVSDDDRTRLSWWLVCAEWGT